jgi:hypothetical protein
MGKDIILEGFVEVLCDDGSNAVKCILIST